MTRTERELVSLGMEKDIVHAVHVQNILYMYCMCGTHKYVHVHVHVHIHIHVVQLIFHAYLSYFNNLLFIWSYKTFGRKIEHLMITIQYLLK